MLNMTVLCVSADANFGCSEAGVGIIASHIFHFLSVLMLHQITLLVSPATFQSEVPLMAWLAAGLHIISPAGIFLSAPYAESAFSFLNFAGCLAYVKSVVNQAESKHAMANAAVSLSGIVFGLATTLRGNGLLSGLTLIYDAVTCLSSIFHGVETKSNLSRLLTVCISGTLMASIAIVPQYVAYEVYCRSGGSLEVARPWCSYWIPSIYAWVQKEYW